MLLILLLILVILALGGGWGSSRYGYASFGPLGLILLIALILWATGHLPVV